MKRFLLFLTIAIGCSFFASCEKETILTVNQSSLSFEDKGGSQTVSIVANKVWSASSNQSWCKVSPSSGDGSENSNIIISVSCDANDSYDERTCNITVSCGELSKTFAVSQAEGKGLIVSQTEYNLSNEAQTISVEVKANVQYSVEIDNACKSWIKQASTKGLSSNIIQFTISKNNDYDGREGKITIKQTDGALSGTVVVKQSQQNGLFISTPEYNLTNEKHTLTVEVKANVEFEVSPKVDWIRYVETKGLKTSQIVLEVSANDSYDERSGSVVVKQKNGELSGTITIHQEQNYGLILTQTEFSLSNEAHTVDVEVKYNVDFDVVIPDACKDWVSIVGTKGLSSRTYTFSVAKNESYDDRECPITFKQKNGSLSGTVSIKQSQTDGLIAEKTEYKVTAEEQTFDIKIKTNVSYEVVIDDACKDWLSLVQTKGLTESIVSLFVTKNEGDTRKGKIYLKSEGIQEEITIVQKAEAYLELYDGNFRAYCIEHFDKNGDGAISIFEAMDVTEIDCSKRGISHLLGLEGFSNLKRLECQQNNLTYLDISKNTSLTYLNVSNNSLGQLNVSNNKALTEMICGGNSFSSLDLSNNRDLTILSCWETPLTSLDVSNNLKLTYLACSRTYLITNLDVSKNTALTTLMCDGNMLSSLDVTKNTALTELYCDNNMLSSLDITKNIALTKLGCVGNKLTSLDVTKNIALTVLACGDNKLISLDVSKNTALTDLFCGNNLLSNIDVSNNSLLTQMWCNGNQLTNLDVSLNTALSWLECRDNRLTSLDVSLNRALHNLCCSNNQLTSLDVSLNADLSWLECRNNQLTSLDISLNMALEVLYCDNNPRLSVIWCKTGQNVYISHDSWVKVRYK